METFYRFLIGDEPRGFYYLLETSNRILSYTTFRLDDGSVYVNRFDLEIDAAAVTRCRHNEGAVVRYDGFGTGSLPGSAYPLLLPRVERAGSLSYQVLSEDEPVVTGSAILTRQGDEISEVVDGSPGRRFTMRGDVAQRIAWGGNARSEWVPDGETAVAGTGLIVAIPTDWPFER